MIKNHCLDSTYPELPQLIKSTETEVSMVLARDWARGRVGGDGEWEVSGCRVSVFQVLEVDAGKGCTAM